MALVIREIAEPFIGIEEQIFFPLVRDAVFLDRSRVWNPIASHSPQPIFRGCPSGISGVRSLRFLALHDLLRSGDVASSTLRHCGQTTVSAWPKPRELHRPAAVRTDTSPSSWRPEEPTRGDDI